MSAPAVVDLPDRILQKIRRACSKRPARALDVLALVGGAEAEFWASLEALISGKAINTAHIQRHGDAEPWLAIWPTGVHKPAAGWTNNAHSCLFTPSEPMRDTVHKTDSTRVRAEPKPAPVRPFAPLPANPLKSPVQRAILAATRGRSQARALRVPDLAGVIGCKNENLNSSLAILERDERIALCRVSAPDAAGRTRHIRAVYDPTAPAEASPQSPPAPQPPQEPTPMTNPKHSATAGRDYARPLQARILAAVAGLARADAITCDELALRTDASKETLASSLRIMRSEKTIGHCQIRSPRGKPVHGYYEREAQAALDALLGETTEAEPEAEPEPEPAPAPASESPEIQYDPDDVAFPPAFVPEPEFVDPSTPTRFALWDDGTLVVQASTGPLVIDPDGVERLARLLGVPRNTAEAGVAA